MSASLSESTDDSPLTLTRLLSGFDENRWRDLLVDLAVLDADTFWASLRRRLPDLAQVRSGQHLDLQCEVRLTAPAKKGEAAPGRIDLLGVDGAARILAVEVKTLDSFQADQLGRYERGLVVDGTYPILALITLRSLAVTGGDEVARAGGTRPWPEVHWEDLLDDLSQSPVAGVQALARGWRELLTARTLTADDEPIVGSMTWSEATGGAAPEHRAIRLARMLRMARWLRDRVAERVEGLPGPVDVVIRHASEGRRPTVEVRVKREGYDAFAHVLEYSSRLDVEKLRGPMLHLGVSLPRNATSDSGRALTRLVALHPALVARWPSLRLMSGKAAAVDVTMPGGERTEIGTVKDAKMKGDHGPEPCVRYDVRRRDGAADPTLDEVCDLLVEVATQLSAG